MEDAGLFNYDSVVFVTHSMGGLIAKRIVNAYNTVTKQDFLKRVAGVVLISTPSQGAPPAELASWISMNPQLKDMTPADLNSYLQSVENQWQEVLRDRDKQNARRPRAYCAYETQPMNGILVVSRVYAATRCDNNPYLIDLDHATIVKPYNRADDPYPWTKARILESVRSAPSALSPTPSQQHQAIAGRGQLFVTTVTTEWRRSSDTDVTRSTADHHCSRNCEGEPTRTNYRLELRAESGYRLLGPSLECVAGACPWSQVHSVQLQDDGRLAVASFDVWGRPTTWRLRAQREQSFETPTDSRGTLTEFHHGDTLAWRVPKGSRTAEFRGNSATGQAFVIDLGGTMSAATAAIFEFKGKEESGDEIVFSYVVK